MDRTLVVALILALIPALALAQDPGGSLLLRASFDESLTADQAHGDPEPVWAREGTRVVEGGVSGSCAEVPSGGNLCFDAPGNAYWERGTLAFWWQCADPVGTTEFDLATIGAFNHFYYGRWYRLYVTGGRLYAYLIDWHHDPKRAPISAGDFQPEQGQWYHIAMAWDAARGIGLYVNGQLAGESGVPWYMPTPLNQIGLGMSAVAAHARSGALRTQRFDEVQTWDQWLPDEAIAALARGEEAHGGLLDEEAIARHRITSLGLDRIEGLPVAPRDGRTLVVTQPRIVTAKDVLRTQLTGVDGKLDTEWPSGRRYVAEGSRYDITMAGEPINYVAMTATMRGRVQLVADGAATVALTRERDDPWVMRALLDEPVAADSVHVLREVSEDPSAAQHDGAMTDLQLLYVDSRRPQPAMTADAAPLAVMPPEAIGPAGVTVAAEYLASDRVTLAPGEGTTEPVELPPMHALQIVSAAYERREIVGPVSLELAIDAPAGTLARIEMVHPLNYTRRQLVVDCALDAGDDSLRLLLIPRRLVLEPGQRLRLVVSFTQPVTVDPAGSAIHPFRELHDGVDFPMPSGPAGPYVEDQMRMLKEYFMLLSEARPWGWPPEKIKRLGELYACMDQLRALVPEDPRVLAYYHWTHAGEPKPLPEIAPPQPGVPEWAAYQVRLIDTMRQVPQWWIENRQVESGEFGSNDGPNDDSVLVQDWLGMYLMCDRDPALLESARRVADMCWARMMTDGWNNQVTDPLHAYEWGMNVTCMMAVMDYGNPVWIERMMAMARHLEELTAINDHGHRHYRSNRYGLGGIITEGAYGWDTTANALNLQPAALLGWYNGNAEARRYLTEWVDAWCEDLIDPADGKGRGYTVEFATEQRDPQRLTSYAFPLIVWAAYDQTGEQRYLDCLGTIYESDRRFYPGPQRTMDLPQQMLGLGREDVRQGFEQAIAEVDLWTAPIRYTDTRPELKYLEWLLTGDRRPVIDALRATLSDMSWELPMWTEAEQSPDRLWLPQPLTNHLALGDVALLRNRIYPLHHVSWTGTGGKLAAWVLDKGPDHLRAWLVNLGEEPITPSATVWRLEHGTYDLRLGADLDEDGRLDAPAANTPVELARGWSVVVGTLPPRAVMLLEIEQTDRLDPITARADLAVCDRDLSVDPQTGAAALTVHNIGGADAGPFTVRVARPDGVEASYEVAGLGAPAGFEPSRATVPLTGLDLADADAVEVRIETAQPQITLGNDRATIPIRRAAEAPVPAGHPVIDG